MTVPRCWQRSSIQKWIVYRKEGQNAGKGRRTLWIWKVYVKASNWPRIRVKVHSVRGPQPTKHALGCQDPIFRPAVKGFGRRGRRMKGHGQSRHSVNNSMEECGTSIVAFCWRCWRRRRNFSTISGCSLRSRDIKPSPAAFFQDGNRESETVFWGRNLRRRVRGGVKAGHGQGRSVKRCMHLSAICTQNFRRVHEFAGQLLGFTLWNTQADFRRHVKWPQTWSFQHVLWKEKHVKMVFVVSVFCKIRRWRWSFESTFLINLRRK